MITISAETTLYDARGILLERGIRHLAVCDTRGDVIGMITISTILHSLHAQFLNIAKRTAEEAAHAKAVFLANVSHELRTPLQSILGFAELGIKRAGERSPEVLRGYFEDIHEGGQRLLTFINDLLDMSKMEAGRMEYRFRMASLSEIVAQVAVQTRPLFDRKFQRLTIVPTAISTVSDVDPERIGQVVRNLLANANKFTPPGQTIAVSFEQGRLMSPQGGLCAGVSVCVADSGIGIPDGEMHSIFEKFVQGSRTSGSGKGTGLGLAICREIILAHAGTISAASRPEGGAIFTFTLPCATPAKGDLP